MKTAKELFMAYHENINQTDVAINLFADDAAIEMPYFNSLNLPWRWSGKEAIYGFLKNLPAMFPGFTFQNIHIYIDTPEQAFAEYEADSTVAATGKPYHQHYMGRLVAHDGKIKLLREAFNWVPVIKSSFPSEIADLLGK